MIKLFCDACQNEVHKEDRLISSFVFVTKVFQMVQNSPSGLSETQFSKEEKSFCEKCTEKMKKTMYDITK